MAVAATQMDLDTITLSDISKKEEEMIWDHIIIWYHLKVESKTGYIWNNLQNRNRVTDLKKVYDCQRGKVERGEA